MLAGAKVLWHGERGQLIAPFLWVWLLLWSTGCEGKEALALVAAGEADVQVAL